MRGRLMKSAGLAAACACAIAVAATAAQEPAEPACLVTYKVDATQAITVTSARCDTAGLEPDAIAFALSRVEGPFRDMLVAQAPIEIEFTFSEAVIRRHRLSQEGTTPWL